MKQRSMNEDLQRYLASFGIKPSIQRLAIMDYLTTYRTHPTADEIYTALARKIPTLSKTTVYNTLNLLAAKGVILALHIDPYHTHYDGDITSHGHFICKACGRIYDLPMVNGSDFTTELPNDFNIEEIQVHFRGTCGKCRGLTKLIE